MRFISKTVNRFKMCFPYKAKRGKDYFWDESDYMLLTFARNKFFVEITYHYFIEIIQNLKIILRIFLCSHFFA